MNFDLKLFITSIPYCAAVFPSFKHALIYTHKAGGIEDHYWRYSTREFEILRFKNHSNENIITIQIKCSKCDSGFPVIMNLNDLLQRHSGMIDEPHEFPCPKCDTDTLNKSCKLMKTLKNFDSCKRYNELLEKEFSLRHA